MKRFWSEVSVEAAEAGCGGFAIRLDRRPVRTPAKAPCLLPTRALARATSVPVIASGGIASLGDIEALAAAAEDGIEGAIVGRALYDGRIDPAAALALVQNRRAAPVAQGTPPC